MFDKLLMRRNKVKQSHNHLMQQWLQDSSWNWNCKSSGFRLTAEDFSKHFAGSVQHSESLKFQAKVMTTYLDVSYLQ